MGLVVKPVVGVSVRGEKFKSLVQLFIDGLGLCFLNNQVAHYIVNSQVELLYCFLTIFSSEKK